MEWKKMQLPTGVDQLLLNRQIVFLRVGDEIQFPPEEEVKIMEAIREHSAAASVSNSARIVVVGEPVPTPPETGNDGLVEVEWEEDDIDGVFAHHGMLIEYSRWAAKRYGVRIWIGFEPPYESGALWIRPYKADLPNATTFKKEWLGFGDVAYHLDSPDQLIVVPQFPVLLVVDHHGTPVAHVRKMTVELTTRAGLVRNNPFEQLILSRIMNTAVPLALCEGNAEEEEEKKRARDIAEQNAAAYVKLVAKRCGATLRTAESQLNTMEEEIRQLAAKITELSRAAEDQRFIVEQLRQRIGRIKEVAREEYEKICAMDLVESVEVIEAEDVMQVVTSELKIDDTYRLGKMRIKLNFQTGKVSINNLTNRRRYELAEWDHPHVKYGIPCFGNLEGAIAELMGRYEAAAVIEVILAFLQTYNPADVWGKFIVYWEKCEEKEEEEKDEERKTA